MLHTVIIRGNAMTVMHGCATLVCVSRAPRELACFESTC